MKNVLTPLLSMILTILLGLFILSLASSCAQGQPFTPLYPFWVEHEPDGTHDIPGLIEALALGVVNVRHYGAVGDGAVDDTAAIRVAINAAKTAAAAGSGGIYGPGRATGTMPIIYFPPGIYRISDYLTEDVALNIDYAWFIGASAIIVQGDATKNICAGVGYDVRFSGLIFRGGLNAISISTENANGAYITIDDCEFHRQDNACLQVDNDSSSSLITVRNCKFRQDDDANSPGYVMELLSGAATYVSDCWIQCSTPIAIYNAGTLAVTDCAGIPGGDLVLAGGAWVENYNVVTLDNFRMGGESGGAKCLVRNYADMDTSSPVVPTAVSILNCPIYSSGYSLHFDELPNIIALRWSHGLSSTSFTGLHVDDVNVTNADLINFAKYGEVYIGQNYARDLVGLSDDSSAIGTLAAKLLLTKAAHAGDFRNPVLDRYDINDVYGSAEWAAGWNTTGTLSQGYRDDAYGVQSNLLSATADDQYRSFTDTTHLDWSDLAYGETYTWLLRYDVNDCDGPAEIKCYVGGLPNRSWHVTGPGWIVIPFVYLNDTGAALATTDTGYVNVKLDANGDRVVLGRMILLRGLYTECDWDVLTTRASVAPVAMGTALKNNIGFAVGDINYRRNVSLAGVFLDACTTEGNPGTWDTVTLD